MIKKEILHSIVLVIAIATAFIFSKSALVEYEFQLMAALFVILYLKKRLLSKSKSYLSESVIFTLVILILINTTGGLQSQYFFLIYFLLFSLSLILEPVIAISATLSLIVFFLLTGPKSPDLNYLIPIFSLAFITPFAMFLGNQVRQNYELRITNYGLGQKLTRSREDTLLFMSLMLKNHLKTIKNNLENFVGDHQLDEIKKQARRMEKLIDKFEEEI